VEEQDEIRGAMFQVATGLLLPELLERVPHMETRDLLSFQKQMLDYSVAKAPRAQPKKQDDGEIDRRKVLVLGSRTTEEEYEEVVNG
jgi:hypothetical protein